MTSALLEARQRAEEAERLQRQNMSQSDESKKHMATLSAVRKEAHVLTKVLLGSLAAAEQETSSQRDTAIHAVVDAAGGVIARERVAMLVGMREAARGLWLDGYKRGLKGAKFKTSRQREEMKDEAVGQQVRAARDEATKHGFGPYYTILTRSCYMPSL